MATSLSNMFFKGLANRSFGRPLNGLFYCTRYSTTVSNDSETHDDFKPANKLEGSGISLANVIEQDVKDNPVMVYMKGVPDLPQCGFSSLAVRVLKHYDVPISARNILEDVELKNAVKAFSLVFSLFFPCSNWPTFPQIFIKGEFIGGSDIILNMHQTGELKEKLKDITSKK
ncbi:monothiol glutaredoxin-S15, mitochondrial isoform X1 [Vigna radiata var. radiata]|uniref:Monothiol glutaredoxin-S15, mitochondrial isoform X1 n=1 Tax=Vigna radiata var. radiata TaxID=3916 RepID=A0A3Q0FE52_VIGRR|nr:monothiol glutaredoxin-S15, mitochondrial isoform X1 [Vigna radiata var. radiata]